MLQLVIDSATYDAEAAEHLIDVINRTGKDLPQVCYHPQLGAIPFLREKRKDFVGREWLFAEIDGWRVRGAQPALLITGEPGIGKSAIVAALVHENPGGQVLEYRRAIWRSTDREQR